MSINRRLNDRCSRVDKTAVVALFARTKYGQLFALFPSLALLLALHLVCVASLSAVQQPRQSANRAQSRGLNEAMSVAKTGDDTRALALIDALLEKSPDFVPALRLKGKLLENLGNLSEASTIYHRALHLAPDDSALLLKVGAFELAGGNSDYAIALLLRHVQLEPGDGDGLYYLAQAYHLKGNDELALKTIRECVKIEPDIASALQKYGEYLCISGDVEKALQWLLRAKRSDPTLEWIDYDLAVASFYAMDFTGAEMYSARAVSRQPDNRQVLAILAASEVKLSKWEEAKAVFERILAASNDDAPSLLGIGRCELELKDYQASVGTFERLLEIDPTQIQAHFFLSRAYRGMGRIAEAQHEADLHQLMMEQISSAPQKDSAERTRSVWDSARQLLIDGREQDALLLVQKQLQGPNAARPNAKVFVGALYLTMGRTEDALRNLEQALKLNPKVPNAHTYQGILALQQGDLDKADRDLEAELALDPNHSLAMAELGVIRYRQARWSDAADLLAKSKTTVPSLLYLLCDSYFRIGDCTKGDLTAEALAAYARNEPSVIRSLVALLKRNEQSELANRLSVGGKL